MNKTIYLKMDTFYGVITIPFIDIKKVDEFTVGYTGFKKLVPTLIKVLDLPLDKYAVNDVYLTYDKYKRGRDDSCLPIKYIDNNFNDESLINAFCAYLENDPKRIYYNDIRYVKTNGILEYINTGKISSFEIKNAVKAYLNYDRGYKRKRETYFFLDKVIKESSKSEDRKIKIKIDKIVSSDVRTEREMAGFDPEDDSYLSHMLQYSRTSEEAFEKVMDEIGKTSLEELSRLLKKDGVGILDGVSDVSALLIGDIQKLEDCTGMSLEELKANHTSFGRKKGSRK